MTVATIKNSPYISMISKKRPWQAVPIEAGKLVDGSEETLFRALALRHLELPVKDFLEQGLERDLPSRWVLSRLCGTIKRMSSVMMRL